MKQTVTMRPDQSVFDCCLQQYGSLDGLAAMLQDNAALTDANGWPLRAAPLKFDSASIADKAVVKYYTDYALTPASVAMTEDESSAYLTDDLLNPLTDDEGNTLLEG
jgi:hypothetical protein